MGGDRKPPPPSRSCDRCGAWVTTAGQTGGVFCNDSACPFDRLTWGGATDSRFGPTDEPDRPAPSPPPLTGGR